MKRKLVALAVVTLLPLVALATPPATAAREEPPLLRLDGKSLTWENLKQFLYLHVYILSEDTRLSAGLEAMVGKWLDHELLLYQAEQDNSSVSETEIAEWNHWLGYDTVPEALTEQLAAKGLSVEEWRRYQKERLMVLSWTLKQWPISENELARTATRYWREHPSEFSRPEEVRIRHIVTDSEAKAIALRQRVIAGDNFAKLAIEYSLSPDRFNGGEIGPFGKGTLPAVFDQCFELAAGELSPVLKSDYGYHLCKVLHRYPARLISFEEAKAALMRDLRDEWLAKKREEWLNARRGSYRSNLDWNRIRSEFARTFKE